MALTGTIDKRGIVEEVKVEEPEIQEVKDEVIKFEQQQFIGTDGFGIITIKHGDDYSEKKFYNAKWEIADKFFHIKEKGKEKEEGLFIPMAKVKYFRFDLEGELLICGSIKCIDGDNNCGGCKLNPENIEKLEVCGLEKCHKNFSCNWCNDNPNKEKDDEDDLNDSEDSEDDSPKTENAY